MNKEKPVPNLEPFEALLLLAFPLPEARADRMFAIKAGILSMLIASPIYSKNMCIKILSLLEKIRVQHGFIQYRYLLLF